MRIDFVLGSLMGRLVRCAVALLIVSAGPLTPIVAAADQTAAEAMAPLAAESGYSGRIRLAAFMDEPDGYCLDVPGLTTYLLLDRPAWVHTCHLDPFADQVFNYNLDGKGEMRWAFEDYNLCLTARAAEIGSLFDFVACDKPDLQAFSYTEAGEVQLKGTDLCAFVERTGPGPAQKAVEGEDAYGRGLSVNPQYTHLARKLVLQECGGRDPVLSVLSRWYALHD